MGIVKINDTYSVGVDDKVLTLQTNPRTGKDGAIRWDTLGYFSEWPQVFNHILRLNINYKIDRTGIITMRELRQIILDAKEEVKGLLADYSYTTTGQRARKPVETLKG